MAVWTPERYRELAEHCRAEAAVSPAPKAKSLEMMACEYEAKAIGMETDGIAV